MKFFAVFACTVLFARGALAQNQTFAVDARSSEVKIALNTTHELVKR